MRTENGSLPLLPSFLPSPVPCWAGGNITAEGLFRYPFPVPSPRASSQRRRPCRIVVRDHAADGCKNLIHRCLLRLGGLCHSGVPAAGGQLSRRQRESSRAVSSQYWQGERRHASNAGRYARPTAVENVLRADAVISRDYGIYAGGWVEWDYLVASFDLTGKMMLDRAGILRGQLSGGVSLNT